MTLLVYVPQLSPRVKYIFGFIFKDILKTELSFTNNPGDFNASPLPKFSYAAQPLGAELFFKSTNLLFEHKITPQSTATTTFGNVKVPFPVTKSVLPFDVFAASFYFLTRYEEYPPIHNANDQLYPGQNSLQHQLGVLKIPIIDDWALILKNILLKHFPALSFGAKGFTFQPVYVANQQKKTDHFISRTISTVKALIKSKLNGQGEKIAGIKAILADMQHFGWISSRGLFIPDHQNEHHFNAAMKIPKSYVKLTSHKAKNDYSIHYQDYPGFRAGTCTPFFWYDLQLEKDTQLRLHPVAATDLALLGNKTSESMLLQMNELIASVKLVNGHFYFLSLCNDIRPQ